MFDAAASRKWGICWSERLKCTRYMYVGKHYKLFEEVPSNIRGRRSGKPNVGLQLGLMSTPISNYGACRLFVNTDIIPPTYSAMRKQSNKISQAMVALNAKNMHEIRDTIARENELCGNKNSHKVCVEGDSCYNNPLFNSDSTPFQAGTIVTTTMYENNTSNKQMIGAFVGSKLCQIGSRLNNQGKDVIMTPCIR